jgi:hypothetical protein
MKKGPAVDPPALRFALAGAATWQRKRTGEILRVQFQNYEGEFNF